MPDPGGSIDLLTALDLLGKAEQERDEANAACESHEVERTMAEARVAELEADVDLARSGIPDPMHPSIPPEFVDGLVGAQIVLAGALGHCDPGDVAAARAALAAVRQEKP
jgi:hypothetical protein